MSTDKQIRTRSDSIESDNSSNHSSIEMNNKNNYVVLCETSGREFESWYYFIRYEGNEKALEYLQKQLEKIDMYILDDFSTFDLDLDHFFSETTAKEMTSLEVNSYSFHRKFDGKMAMISLGLKKRDDNDDMLEKLFDKLGLGQIEDYVEDEDIDSDDLVSDSDEHDSDESSDEDEDLTFFRFTSFRFTFFRFTFFRFTSFRFTSF
jgi:hypothetical protein